MRRFDVVRIYGSMRFELLAALLVAAGVVQGYSALPELRSTGWREFRNRSNPCGGFGDASALKSATTRSNVLARHPRPKRTWRSDERRKPGQASRHCVHSLLRSRNRVRGQRLFVAHEQLAFGDGRIAPDVRRAAVALWLPAGTRPASREPSDPHRSRAPPGVDLPPALQCRAVSIDTPLHFACFQLDATQVLALLLPPMKSVHIAVLEHAARVVVDNASSDDQMGFG